MVEIRRLDPHAPLPDGLGPDGRGRYVVVFSRFDEDDPRAVFTEIILADGPGNVETTRPVQPDGTPMSFDEAIEAGRQVADSEGLDVVYAVDRTAGAREREVLAHGGDHTVGMAGLQDTDPEDGERGPDMRKG